MMLYLEKLLLGILTNGYAFAVLTKIKLSLSNLGYVLDSLTLLSVVNLPS